MNNFPNNFSISKLNFNFTLLTWVAMLGYFIGIFLWVYLFDFVTLVYAGKGIFYASLGSLLVQMCCLFDKNAKTKSALNMLALHILIMGGFLYFWWHFALSL